MEQSPSVPDATLHVHRGGGVVAGLVLGAVFFALALPLMLWSPRVEFDEVEYHLPAILRFADDWPHFAFHSYTSATTPGYHLVLAGVARYVSKDVRLLRVVGSLFTVGMLLTAGIAVGRRTGALAGITLCLPLLCSPYIFRTGVWIIPQNAGWWGVLAILVIALRPKVDWVTYVSGALVLAALVFVRQLHLWAAAVLWLAAWLGPPSRERNTQLTDRVRRSALMFLATLPSFLIVLYFVHLWGGTVPSIYQRQGELRTGPVYMDGGNPAVPAVVLSLTAIIGTFFLPLAWRRFIEALRTDRRIVGFIAGAALIGLLVGIMPKTSFDLYAGRSSGIWNGVRRLPTFADRSPLIIALSAAGGVMVAVWWAALRGRDRWLFFASFVVFTIAQSFSSMAWQRYHEPFLLMLFPLAVARIIATEGDDVAAARPRISGAALGGPLLLAIALATITTLTLGNVAGLGTFAPSTAPITAPTSEPAMTGPTDGQAASDPASPTQSR
jgi:hypothetical protein